MSSGLALVYAVVMLVVWASAQPRRTKPRPASTWAEFLSAPLPMWAPDVPLRLASGHDRNDDHAHVFNTAAAIMRVRYARLPPLDS